MNRITFDPLPGTEGMNVADLQNGLRLLLERKVLEVGQRNRLEYLSGLASEALEPRRM